MDVAKIRGSSSTTVPSGVPTVLNLNEVEIQPTGPSLKVNTGSMNIQVTVAGVYWLIWEHLVSGTGQQLIEPYINGGSVPSPALYKLDQGAQDASMGKPCVLQLAANTTIGLRALQSSGSNAFIDATLAVIKISP